MQAIQVKGSTAWLGSSRGVVWGGGDGHFGGLLDVMGELDDLIALMKC